MSKAGFTSRLKRYDRPFFQESDTSNNEGSRITLQSGVFLLMQSSPLIRSEIERKERGIASEAKDCLPDCQMRATRKQC